jgi:hypothetical protein
MTLAGTVARPLLGADDRPQVCTSSHSATPPSHHRAMHGHALKWVASCSGAAQLEVYPQWQTIISGARPADTQCVSYCPTESQTGLTVLTLLLAQASITHGVSLLLAVQPPRPLGHASYRGSCCCSLLTLQALHRTSCHVHRTMPVAQSFNEVVAAAGGWRDKK